MDTAALDAVVRREALQPVTREAQAIATLLREHYGPQVAAVVFYGSCLRDNDPNGLFDFYVLVDRYRPALGAASAAFARLLPPNVYYHDIAADGRMLRAKVAVMRLDQFVRGLGERAFSSTLSARFAQPAAIVFARDDRVCAQLVEGFRAAVATTIARTLPLLPGRITARDLWTRALTESFAAELRPESARRIEALVAHGIVRYEDVTAAVLGAPVEKQFINPAGGDVRTVRRVWMLRRIHGKTLNAARLIKAAFTFRGGLDYAAWKIRRHSGMDIALTAHDRAHPLIAGVRLFFVALSRGGLR